MDEGDTVLGRTSPHNLFERVGTLNSGLFKYETEGSRPRMDQRDEGQSGWSLDIAYGRTRGPSMSLKIYRSPSIQG